MERTKKQKKTQELLQRIVRKAWEDKAFKVALMSNPIEAIEEITGEKIDLPKGKQLVIKDQTDESIIYINIPAKPKMKDMELSEEQLEALAGGAIFGL